MARTPRPDALLRGLCKRLVKLMDEYVRMPDNELAAFLGYANSSTLWKVRRFAAFIDVHRLTRLGELRVCGMRPNIDWLITGEGNPMVRVRAPGALLQQAAAALVALGPEERKAVLVLARGRRRSR